MFRLVDRRASSSASAFVDQLLLLAGRDAERGSELAYETRELSGRGCVQPEGVVLDDVLLRVGYELVVDGLADAAAAVQYAGAAAGKGRKGGTEKR
ncbi:hypothetical protein [Streptomyces sp. NPDC005407]|uniref:hypothetical protein n=1 Tax=Streptomyces sp. NPDC005407 TaxID=3155340 RepID=UPI0033BE046F